MAQTTPSAAAAAQAAAPDALRFDIFEFVIEGNTVLPGHLIENAVSPFLGERKTIADAEGARKAVERLYQDAGYLSVSVELPPQRVGSQGGEVKLLITEAKLEQLRVSDAQYNLPSQIRQGLPSLRPGAVPNFQDMQDELSALSRQGSDREITPLVTAGEQESSVNIDLKVRDELPLHGMVELNSKQSPNTQRTRLEASVSYDNLFQRQHGLNLYWFYSPLKPAESNVLSMNYQLPLGQPGDRLFASFTTSNSNTPTTLGGATVSKGETYGLRWRHNLMARGSYTHAVTLSGDYRNSRDQNQDVAGFSTESPDLSYPSLGVSYDLTRFGQIPDRVTTFEAALTMSTHRLAKREVTCPSDDQVKDQFECKRAGATPNFEVMTLKASHREPIYKGWNMYGRLQAHLASGPLVPAEQITAGGADSVRGYFEGEQAGDNGVLVRLELNTPTWAVDGLRTTALAFFDRAQLTRLDALPGEVKRTQLGSTGFGFRFDGPWGLSATLDWARVLYDTPLSGGQVGRGHRVELSVRQSF